MQIPSHEECLKSQDSIDRRNRLYLRFIFDHSERLCDDVFLFAGNNYADAYYELVRREGHGTPGSSLRSRATVPAIPLLTNSSHSADFLSDAQRLRLLRGDELVNTWRGLSGPARQFWDNYWAGSYRGFRRAQKEMGKLRDDISRGEFEEGISRHTLDFLKKGMNEMLLASVREWYMKWGELDLHRLSFKDALETIRSLLIHKPWKEVRVVAGQRPHLGDDHHSEGVLYSLLHRLFDHFFCEDLKGIYGPDQEELIRDIQRYVRENDVEVSFYSNGAAVYLKKKRKARANSGRLRPYGYGRLRKSLL